MSMSRLLAALILSLSLVAAGCGGQKEESGGGASKRLSIATGNTTGVYYQLGGAMARLASKETDFRVSASETGASAQNIKLVVAGEQDIGFSLLDTASDAVKGEAGFDGQKQDIQAMMGLYPNYTHVVVRKDSGISSIADMKGKRVSTGSPQSGTEVIAERLLEAGGVDPEEDIERQRLELGKTVEAMKDGSIDALFWSGGLPTPGIEDLFTSQKGKVELLDTSSQLPALQKEFGDVYEDSEIPSGTYPGADAAPSIRVQNVLVVPKDFDPATAKELAALFLKQQPELAKAVPAAKDLSPKSAQDTAPLELNSGAKEAIDAAGSK